MKCEICNDGKDYKNIKAHKRLAHPPDNPVILELKAKIAELEQVLDSKGKSAEVIAKILYEDVAKAICDSHGISLGDWEGIDHNDYLKVARKIKG